jgi:predicted outer membrane repeat protein
MAKRQRRKRRERRREHAQRAGWQTRHSVITGAGIAAGAALGVAAPALGAAGAYYVGSNGDGTSATDCATYGNTDCTLRKAILDANANASQYDYVVFQPTVTGNVALSTGEIPITDAVYIYGNGADVNTITAAANNRIFNVNPNYGDRVGIFGLTLTGGNAAGNGGAISNVDALLGVFDSVLTGNSAGGVGGAIYEKGDYESGAYDVISRSTFSGNHADSGGGIYAAASFGYVGNDTFIGNTAESGDGGAIRADVGNLYDNTISGNSATTSGGGVSAISDLLLIGTIFANNTAGTSQPDLNAPGGGSGSFDLVETPGNLVFAPNASVITGQDPQLGSLQNNGGTTPTLKPAASSPVVDQSLSYYAYDQRLGDRVIDNPNKPNATGGNGADIGSVELSVAEGPQATPPAPAPVIHKKKCKKKKKHKRSAAVAKKKCKKKKKRSAASAIRYQAPLGTGAAWPSARHRHAFQLDR